MNFQVPTTTNFMWMNIKVRADENLNKGHKFEEKPSAVYYCYTFTHPPYRGVASASRFIPVKRYEPNVIHSQRYRES